jgi:SAM-dependent methyltransferase
VLQNVTYPTRELAIASPAAPFELAGCVACGFMFNARFDPGLFAYDVEYDNHVESGVFDRYYRELARLLIDEFDLANGGTVYDVGCGRGTFLRVLCELAPKITGIGVDPSCDPIETGNLKLIRSTFSDNVIRDDAKLVLLRHVLEHIARPLDFVRELRRAVRRAPVFVEVPEASWIFANNAFWDFCYEHCNYFAPGSLRSVLERGGFELVRQQISFGGQYQWAICRPGREEATGAPDGSLALGKGVVFASLMREGLIAGGIDSNVRKQGRYAPGSGLQIHPPQWLTQLDGPATGFVMNPNYLQEMRDQMNRLGADIELRPIAS